MSPSDIVPYLEAAALGLLVGLERAWSHRRAEQEAAGPRTFVVLALAGAVAHDAGPNVVAAGAIGCALLLMVGYLKTAHTDRGITTESAALITFLLGAEVLINAALAVGVAVVMTVALAIKGPIHRFSRDILSDVEVIDALKFLVAVFVVLPLLPNHPLGPYGALNPVKIWTLVVVLSGIGWGGYIGVRALGPRRGLAVMGFAGGFVSATAASASLARLVRANRGLSRPALVGVLLASSATLIQLMVVLSVANPRVLGDIAPAAAVGTGCVLLECLLLEGVVGLRGWRREPAGATAGAADPAPDVGGRPFRLGPAVLLAAVLTVVTVIARWSSAQAGSAGVVAAAALAGFADAHAPSLAVAGIAATGAVPVHTAVLAAASALATNTISKIGVTFWLGGAHFGLRFASAMVLPVVATGLTLAITLV